MVIGKFKIFFPILLVFFLSACLHVEEKVTVRENGSLSYVVDQKINRSIIEDMLAADPQQSISMTDVLLITDRSMQLAVRKYHNIQGVEYASWIGDLSTSRSAPFIESRFELVVDSVTNFPRVLREMREVQLSNNDRAAVFSGLGISEAAKNAYGSMPSGIESFFTYKVEEKTGGQYRILISSDYADEGIGALSSAPSDQPTFTVQVSAPDIVYTNLDENYRSGTVTAELDFTDLVSSNFNGIIEFELNFMAQARGKILDGLNTLFSD